jgi:hypothetical protein
VRRRPQELTKHKIHSSSSSPPAGLRARWASRPPPRVAASGVGSEPGGQQCEPLRDGACRRGQRTRRATMRTVARRSLQAWAANPAGNNANRCELDDTIYLFKNKIGKIKAQHTAFGIVARRRGSRANGILGATSLRAPRLETCGRRSRCFSGSRTRDGCWACGSLGRDCALWCVPIAEVDAVHSGWFRALCMPSLGVR